MIDRWPGWLARNVEALPPPQHWPGEVDVDDLILEACKHTHFTFSYGRQDLWNNPVGTRATIEAAKKAGCEITSVEGERSQHCYYFGDERI
jgi:hypothetical protein